MKEDNFPLVSFLWNGVNKQQVVSLYLVPGAHGDSSWHWSFLPASRKLHSFVDKHHSENSHQTTSGSERLWQTGCARTVSGCSGASRKNSSMALLNKARVLLAVKHS